MSKIEEFDQLWSPKLPRGSISWIVNKYHVSATMEEIGDDIRNRAQLGGAGEAWPEEMIAEAVRYAEAQHEANIKLYQLVMRG